MKDSTVKLALAALAAAALSGCASTRSADLAQNDAPKMEEQQQVSRPAAYGSRGGYRYRRLVAVNIVPG